MEPRNKNNFLVEITPEVMDELNQLYMHSDDEPIVELHYSPYWKEFTETTPTGGDQEGEDAENN